jgi:phosphomannomutase
VTDPAVDPVLAAASAWIDQDPDAETRAELAALIAAGTAESLADLHDRFDTRLAFGTAGLRGEIAAGPNRMNRVLVAQAAAGIAAFLLKRAVAGVTPSVVIGYDGRRNSRIFATDSAEIMAGAGIRAILLPRLLPTPLVAFAVRELDVSAGIMVTASHNPPNDNGYKVYLGDNDEGAQIVPPVDTAIANEIMRVAAEESVALLPRSNAYEIAAESVIEAYVAQTVAIITRPTAGQPQPLVVYTAMHGVGWETFSSALHAAGFTAPVLVRAQISPDATFPTVAFPNPEEPGAMDLAYETARASGADLVIANDPDADRLAIAVPDSTTVEGYRRLTGNEVGALLGWRAAERLRTAAGPGEPLFGTLACSIVSSPALAAVARDYGLTFQDTLTGFKWVSRAPGIIYGYEEALGYLVDPDVLRDKDGISAGLAFLELAATLSTAGLSVSDHLDAFSMRFGHFASAQVSLRFTDVSEIAGLMHRLRAAPPSEVGGIRVDRIEDLAAGSPELPASDVLRVWLVGGSRIMVRPSGTEPKLKVYIDTACADGTLAGRRAEAEALLTTLEVGMRALLA